MTSMSTHSTGAGEQPGLFALVTSDTAAAAALTAAYRGTRDVLDALWWREHPLATSPAGRADPAGALPPLKAAAYSRNASADALAELFALESRLAADAERLEQAILDARPALEAAEARRAAAVELRARGAAEPVGDPVRGAEATDTAPDLLPLPPAPGSGPGAVSAETWRRRSLVWMTTSIAVGVLLLVAVGLVVASLLGSGPFLQSGSGAGGAAAAGAGDASGAAETDAPALPGGLTIFEDPGLAPSIPPQNIDPYYKPESLRLLGVADSDLTVYAVENRIDQPCLLAVYVDGTQSATCVTKQEFGDSGIQLRITSLRIPPAGASLPTAAPAEDVVFWNADGSFGVTSTPSLRPTTIRVTPAPSPTAP